jgi:hypothetical protein
MPSCTDFCNSLSTIRLSSGTLPSHDQLIQHLPATKEIHEWPLGTWHEIQQRDGCEFCQLVVIGVLRTIHDVQYDEIEPDQAIDVVLFPLEQCFRLLYPSPMGLRMAFVAGGSVKPFGPDTARLVLSQDLIVPRVRHWLRTCDDRHPNCQWKDSTLGWNKSQVSFLQNDNQCL